MTDTFYRTGRYKVDHTQFGGELTQFDFDGHHTMTTMAGKIMKDFSFDMQRARDIELRNNRNIKHGGNKYA